MLDFVLNFLFPPSCIICGKRSQIYICDKCEKRFERHKKFNVFDNKKMYFDKYNLNNMNENLEFYEIDNQKKYWERMIYCFDYKSIVRRYMIEYKFNGKNYISNFFAYQIIKNIDYIFNLYDIIIPVPMEKSKKAERGYNQTELVTHILSKECGICEAKILKKKKTKTQSSLSLVERQKNIENAFSLEFSEFVKNKKIILFDDIYTTGSTVNEISKILKIAGAREILVLVIAKD